MFVVGLELDGENGVVSCCNWRPLWGNFSVWLGIFVIKKKEGKKNPMSHQKVLENGLPRSSLSRSLKGVKRVYDTTEVLMSLFKNFDLFFAEFRHFFPFSLLRKLELMYFFLSYYKICYFDWKVFKRIWNPFLFSLWWNEWREWKSCELNSHKKQKHTKRQLMNQWISIVHRKQNCLIFGNVT